MKVFLSIVLLLLSALTSFGEGTKPNFFSVGNLKKVVKSYLDEEGKAPAPEDPVRAMYVVAYVHGMISALETADVVLEHKQPILQHFKNGDPKQFFADFDEYLNRMKVIADDADGHKLIIHFLFTNYTENAALKLKMAPSILDVLKVPRTPSSEDKDGR